jgi:hypothetical protein
LYVTTFFCRSMPCCRKYCPRSVIKTPLIILETHSLADAKGDLTHRKAFTVAGEKGR